MEVQNPFQIPWDRFPYQTFLDFFLSKITAHGSNLALIDIDTNKQWRYSEIKVWVTMAAERLREMGVTEKSRVAIISGTTGQTIFIHLACSSIGCTAVAVNGHQVVDEIWQLVDASDTTHLIAEGVYLQKAEDVRRKAQMRGQGRIKAVKSFDDILSSDALSFERRGYHAPSSKPPPLLRNSSSQKLIKVDLSSSPTMNESISMTNGELLSPVSDNTEKQPQTDSDHSDVPYTTPTIHDSTLQAPNTSSPYIIFFTSGTTNAPKPVEVTHRSLIINIQQMGASIYGPVQCKERFLLPLSLSHLWGLLSAFYALVQGATICTLHKWSTKSVADAFVYHKINVSHISTPMIHNLANDTTLETIHFPFLRSLIVSGSPVDVSLLKLCRSRFRIGDVRQAYGMSELGGLCTLPFAGTDKPESVGAPLPGMLLKVVNWETQMLCAPRQLGHLYAAGPQVSPKYFKNPKATNEIVEADGFVRTGDAAYYDENGLIYVVDRIKDIIKCKGTLVCPSEVEVILRSHPGIDDCAVVGRQDHVTGEVPAAFVVRNPSFSTLSSSEVRQFAAASGKIAQFKELRGGVFFVSEIPRNVCGKVLRRNLRQFWDRERSSSKADLLIDKIKLPSIARSTASSAAKQPPPRPISAPRGSISPARSQASLSKTSSRPGSRTSHHPPTPRRQSALPTTKTRMNS
ncbi:unnamed protein product, partial [Mesorhabditis belari]|uniref:Uncharacterized protein n=1 Tax=Mesorhabditis belari TaxID=2138241 RepID=A0AAF3J323_9BILA